MPNTLAHIGFQGLFNQLLIRGVDVKWVFLGLIIPDLPFIAFRVLKVTVAVDPYALRLYAIGQSSLVCCILLSGAVAAFCERPRLIFAVLSLNSLVHLLLDACQKKLASGVHLFAPFSSNPVNFGLFWPEGWPTYVMILMGLIYFLWAIWFPADVSIELRLGPPWRRIAGVALLLAYLFAPLALHRGLWIADSHFVRTLSETTQRPGREVEFDRNSYKPRDGPDVLVTFAREEIILVGPSLERPAEVSLRGRFLDEHTIVVLELHEHAGGFRDIASYVGLALVALTWALAIARQTRRQGPRQGAAARRAGKSVP